MLDQQSLSSIQNHISGYVAHWVYTEQARPVMIVARYDQKGIKTYRQFKDDDGRWVEGVTSTPYPLFGLSSLCNSSPLGGITICEGEKCASLVHQLGWSCVSTALGAKNISSTDFTPFITKEKVMTTEAQVQANRQNALKSTGPQTIEGKKHSCQNSVKHGLLSKDLLMGNEKLKDLDAFRDGVYASLSPQGGMEVLLVEKIVNSAWRLRRLTKAENEVIAGSDEYSSIRGINKAFRGYDGTCLQNLSRYESALERIFYKAIHELQRLQAMRMGVAIGAPITLEVNVEGQDGIGFVS